MVQKSTQQYIEQKKAEGLYGWEPTEPIHPGEHLEDILKRKSISQAELAKRLGVSPKHISEIVQGKAPITHNIAEKLERVLGASAGFWVNLQQEYDRLLAAQTEEQRLASDIAEQLPKFKDTYRELCRRGIVRDLYWAKSNLPAITKILQSFFSVGTLASVGDEVMGFSFRTYQRDNINPYTLAAWVQLGIREAAQQQTQPFDKKKIRRQLHEIKKLSRKEPDQYLPELIDVFAELGIVLVYQPSLKNAFAQGAARWLNKEKALVILNTKKRHEGQFWFNLYHEIGHLLLHGKKHTRIDVEDGIDDKEESEADSFARKMLVPNFEEIWERLRQSQNHERVLKNFAKELEVSEAIVAGTLTNDLKDRDPKIYAKLNDFLPHVIDYSCINRNSDARRAYERGDKEAAQEGWV